MVESHTQSMWTGYGKSPLVVESHTQSMWTGYGKSPPVVESHTLFSYIYFYLCCPLIFPYYYLMNGILLTKVRLFDLENLRMLLLMMESNILSSKQLTDLIPWTRICFCYLKNQLFIQLMMRNKGKSPSMVEA